MTYPGRVHLSGFHVDCGDLLPVAFHYIGGLAKLYFSLSVYPPLSIFLTLLLSVIALPSCEHRVKHAKLLCQAAMCLAQRRAPVNQPFL